MTDVKPMGTEERSRSVATEAHDARDAAEGHEAADESSEGSSNAPDSPSSERHVSQEGSNSPELRGFSRAECLALLQDMLVYRRFEEQAEQAYAIGKIGGFCHLHVGQEGVAAGCIKPLRSDDYVISAYREHTQALAKGADPGAVMAELYGRAPGVSGGRGGSMHLFSNEARFMGGHGIVGGQTALGLGLAFAIHYRGGDQVCLCFMGDAAINQGAFHESMNMAAVWGLPVIFIVENNDYGMGTRFSRVSALPMLERATGYGVPISQVNGQDVLATYRHFEELVGEVRDGGGPRFVDVLTYRFKGHSMSDPVSGTYRTKEEVTDQTEGNDPIKILRDRLMTAGWLDQGELEAMDEEVRGICEEAAAFADAAPEPGPDELYRHVYAEINEHGRLFFDGRER
jgi:pyruvate dehydrogenase E1 component alpha subunit